MAIFSNGSLVVLRVPLVAGCGLRKLQDWKNWAACRCGLLISPRSFCRFSRFVYLGYVYLFFWNFLPLWRIHTYVGMCVHIRG